MFFHTRAPLHFVYVMFISFAKGFIDIERTECFLEEQHVLLKVCRRLLGLKEGQEALMQPDRPSALSVSLFQRADVVL